MNKPLENLRHALANLADSVNEVRKCLEEYAEMYVELKDDPDTVLSSLTDLLDSLNNHDLIRILSFSFGNQDDTPVEIEFDVLDNEAWAKLRSVILTKSADIDTAEIAISERYSLDWDNDIETCWILSIMPIFPDDEEEAKTGKIDAIKRLVELIEDYVEVGKEDAK